MTRNTPAAERAAELIMEESETTGLIFDDVWRGLAAALDVEEMAGALYVSEHPYDTLENWRNHGAPQSKAVYYRLATAIRTSILGEP